MLFSGRGLPILGSGVRSLDDFDQYITKEGVYCVCTICGNVKNKSITNVRCHIESKHFPGTFKYTCDYCEKVLFSKISHRDHTAQCKRLSKFYQENCLE